MSNSKNNEAPETASELSTALALFRTAEKNDKRINLIRQAMDNYRVVGGFFIKGEYALTDNGLTFMFKFLPVLKPFTDTAEEIVAELINSRNSTNPVRFLEAYELSNRATKQFEDHALDRYNSFDKESLTRNVVGSLLNDFAHDSEVLNLVKFVSYDAELELPHNPIPIGKFTMYSF